MTLAIETADFWPFEFPALLPLTLDAAIRLGAAAKVY